MKNVTTILVALLVFCAALATSSCAWVTESGNPDVPETQSPSTQGPIYENDTFRVEIAYPFDWRASQPVTVPGEEDAAGDQVCFQQTPDSTYICVHMSLAVPAPSSLETYLAETYPGRSFTSYSTSTLSGYMYDDPSVGPRGGDLREYYFLSGTVFVRVVADVFPEDEDDLASLLSGIKFQ